MSRNRSLLRRMIMLAASAVALLAVGYVYPRSAASADPPKPFLHPLFTDNMVLQRNIADPIWGWTDPGKQVTVSMNGKTATATAGADGKWMAKLGPFDAGGPYTLTVTGPQTTTLHNVLVGDVWICSGQSNMSFNVGSAINAQQEIANSANDNIRLYTVPNVAANTPQPLEGGQWQLCNPQTVGGFTAVGYFFGRDLQEKLKIPIGLIHSSWGGTIAEAWTSAEALKTMPDFAPAVTQLQAAAADPDKALADYQKQMADWWQKNDPGTTGNYQAPDFNAAAWKTMHLPTQWENAGLPNYDGIVWFRRTVTIPDNWAGKDLTIDLGPIDDLGAVFFNGTPIVETTAFTQPERGTIPGNLVKAGQNSLSVRVLDTGGAGGIYAAGDHLTLAPTGATNQQPIALGGDWLYQATTPLNKTAPIPSSPGDNPNVVTVLYNGMIAPLVPFAIKGATWYQGESNVGRAMQYRTLLPTMIKDWRSRFGVADFPFFIVQLANLGQPPQQPGDSGWAELREAQTLTAQRTPKTGIALAVDIGEANDIHPKNKQEVGRRLALSALAMAYGQKDEYSGPVYRSMKVENSQVRVVFDHADGLMAKGGDKLQGFAVAGPDHKYHWADAKIDGNAVVVSSPDVANPTSVRYAWADNPTANLYNGAGLPAVPFRTDSPA